MTIALITTTEPQAIISVYGILPNPLVLPNGEQVAGVSVGWTSQDGIFALAPVVSFTTPVGLINVGSPTYAFDGSGNVIETYATSAPPVPASVALWKAKAALQAAGFLTAANTAVAASSVAVQSFWAQASMLDRNDPIMLSIAAGLGLTSAQVDALFVSAAAISL